MMTNHLNASDNNFQIVWLASRQRSSAVKLAQQVQDFTSRSPTHSKVKNKQVINV